MANQHVIQRLRGLLDGLNSTSTATRTSSSASKGAGRSDFINNYLKQVIPTSLRISTGGEITDIKGSITGELDIIIENGHFPSLPLTGVESSRLLFAEGVAAVIEVKSNLANQWNEVLGTGSKLFQLERKISGGMMMGSYGTTIMQIAGTDFSKNNLGKLPETPQSMIKRKVPYFVVGYHGWANSNTIDQKILESNGIVSGILQLDIEYFQGNSSFRNVSASREVSLLAFINSISEAASYIQIASANFLDYG
ncbi:DUF6602 domain-containing protein [Mucilaginibacter phyllosphaerae]